MRSEIENKLNEKISNKLFYGAISVVVVITSLIYVLSYSKLVLNSETNKDNIDRVLNELKNIKEEISNSKIKIEELTKKQHEIEKEIIKKTKIR